MPRPRTFTTSTPSDPIKRSVMQAVFDSPEALRTIKAAFKEADESLARTPRRMLDPGNPNHPDYDTKLFGYDVDAFMARQYRK